MLISEARLNRDLLGDSILEPAPEKQPCVRIKRGHRAQYQANEWQ
jgi:hypothetical protein